MPIQFPFKNFSVFTKASLCAAIFFQSGAFAVASVSDSSGVIQLKFLGELNIPTGQSPAGITLKSPFGGISGASVVEAAAQKKNPSLGKSEAKTGLAQVLLVSDDRSDRGPARSYLSEVGYDGSRKPTLRILEENTLKTEGGSAFEKNTIDPEGIARTPEGRIFVSQEGSLNANDLWSPPSLVEYGKEWTSKNKLSLPSYVLPLPAPSNSFGDRNNPNQTLGQRYNLSLEGLSTVGNSLFLAVEGPLVQDDSLASFEKGAVTRIFRYDLSQKGTPLAEAFFYPLEAVRKKAVYPPDALADVNGVSEVLFWNSNQGMVLERGGVKLSDGFYDTQLFLYQIDLTGAANILSCASLLKDCPSASKASKKLVLDFSTIKDKLDPSFLGIDNLEAVFFGPVSPNGKKTIWFVSDNNFSAAQRTQILVFEIEGIPEAE